MHAMMAERRLQRVELERAELERVETIRAVGIAAVAALLIVLLGPPPGDAAAHLYRTWLVERNEFVWDNLWFTGNYSILTYSPLYYFLAATLGSVVVNVAVVLVTAGCFAALVVREWGPVAVWPARWLAVCAAGPLITGTAPYGLGLAAAVACLLALQRGRRLPGVALAAITLASSALAFFFLVLTLAAVAFVRRRAARQHVGVAVPLALLGLVWLLVWQLFPSDGRYPFQWWTLAIVTGVAGCGFVLAIRGPESTRLMAALFGLWLASCLVLFVVPSPAGEIVTRLRYLVFPLMLLTVLLGGSRPRWLAILALVGAAAYNVVPYAASVWVRVTGDDRAAQQEYWQPAIDYLDEHHSPDHVVGVVATGAHWEAYHLPRSGIAVVRGWYRQIDMVQNEVLYDDSATPSDYVRWLHDNAVRFVIMPDVRLDPHTGEREAQLVEAADLEVAFLHDDLTIYEVPEATQLLTGTSSATVEQLDHAELHGTVGAPGTYRLRLRWSPHWTVTSGDVTLEEHPESGTIVLVAAEAGAFSLGVDVELPLFT